MTKLTCPQCKKQHYTVLDTDVDKSYTVEDFSLEEKFCSCECWDKYEAEKSK